MCVCVCVCVWSERECACSSRLSLGSLVISDHPFQKQNQMRGLNSQLDYATALLDHTRLTNAEVKMCACMSVMLVVDLSVVVRECGFRHACFTWFAWCVTITCSHFKGHIKVSESACCSRSRNSPPVSSHDRRSSQVLGKGIQSCTGEI